jgi:small GTP-binding protein
MTDAESTVRTYKIVFTGFSGAGKSQIIRQITTGSFDPASHMTIGVEFRSWASTVDGEDMQFQIWDTAGQERFRAVPKTYFRNAVGAVLVFDLTNRKSFDEIPGYMNEVRSFCDPGTLILLLGNKSDDVKHRSVTATEAEEFSKRHNLIYQETSAKTGNGIQETFLNLGRRLLGKVEDRNSDERTPSLTLLNEVCLSAKGMRNIIESHSNERFTFFVGSIEYDCSLMTAKFLSPRICKHEVSDCTNLTFRIETPDPSGYFSEVISLGEGRMIEMTKDKANFLQLIGRELWNSELSHLFFSRFCEGFPNDDIVNCLKDLSENNFADSTDLTFAASHFHQFSISDIRSLDFSILQSILSSPDLLLTDESSL